MNQLEPNSKDRLVSVAKAVAGTLPYIGTLVSELLDNVVPNLRFERIVVFLQALDLRVSQIDEKLEYFKINLASEEGIDLLEEGMLQASRSISRERKERLASILEKSLTKENLKYEESRKILNIFRELTDPEVIWLICYSLEPSFGKGPHSDWVEQHPDVLNPISRTITGLNEQSENENSEKAALQDSYKETLIRLGLIQSNERTTNMTTLGQMVIKYIKD
ncbi:hypothetical protein ES754_10755 [Psychrobacter frigidicola]|uniref:DUF4393 domain-containing protein n=1 Tax=Psychrobacter frigidicola TaxID=45611 RepID=A0A5C7A284_9GAMM|nr:hypothetical protein [Psychrobacter frigidicola]TXD96604.1 hypothetical protein ES754_10755 [Psychrobacter frigidicola]